MARNSENLLFQIVPDGLIKRQEVRTIYVRNGMVTEERVERVFFDEGLEEYSDARSSIPLVSRLFSNEIRADAVSNGLRKLSEGNHGT